jgi:uncharacterized paraquat-inducible protein A
MKFRYYPALSRPALEIATVTRTQHNDVAWTMCSHCKQSATSKRMGQFVCARCVLAFERETELDRAMFALTRTIK